MRNFSFILFLLLPFSFYGQKPIAVKLDWTALQSQRTITSLDINFFSFARAVNTQEFGAIPLYSTIIELPDELFGCELSIKEISSDTLSFETTEILTDAELISDKVFYKIITDKKKANILIVPFRTIENGKRIIRLNEFELVITFVPVEMNTEKETAPRVYKNNSVLSEGTWFKMGILETGVHKISYNNLLEMGLSPEQIDLNNIGVFGNYDGMLPEENSKARFDDLEENAITFIGGEDGKWNENDYLLFFARSAVKWKYNPFTSRFSHQNNSYSDTTYYFFTPSQGSKFQIENFNSTNDEPTQQMDSFIDYAVNDEDDENLIYSGREWYGKRLAGDTLERTFVFNFPNLDTDVPIYIENDMVARSIKVSYYGIDVNGVAALDSLKIDKLPVNSSYYAKNLNKKFTLFVNQGQISVKVKCLTVDPTLLSWVNFIQLNASRKLIFSGGQMMFRDPHISAAGNVTEFTMGGANQSLKVWDVSNIHQPKNIVYQLEGENLRYRLPTDSLKEFVVFENNSYYQPVSYIPVKNQNLHNISNVNMVIVSPPVFLGQANRLAKIHYDADGLTSIVVTPQMVYNEFSSGSQDVAAIRDFMKMLYDKGAFGDGHAYLLLFGDASFDYKHRIAGNTNFVPTYESTESLKETGSFVTDDFFGLLDDSEGSNSTGNLDIGIGRLPVSTIEEATDAVNKIEHYMSRDAKTMGAWRNELCFIADDMDANLHLDQANSMISIADTLHPGIHLNKIFSDAYKKITVPNGTRFPDVNVRIKEQVEQGALIVNYTGHGGLIGWSEESILDVPTIRGFDNIDNMPLFITATCEFSRFDNPEFVSAGELLFLNKNGGGIALMTTTRLAYAHANIVVNRRIYENLMVTDKGKQPRLGDLVRVSKVPSNSNYLNFVLLGDPAMHLAFPENEVVTQIVNNKSTNGTADTVHALSEVNISGYIQDVAGNKMTEFNGYIYPKVYDKPSKYTTLGNDPRSFKVDFYASDRVLFEGKISVVNGNFSFSFLVPKDIAYNYGFGEINYYAVDTVNFVDAWGAYEQIFIGGIDEFAENDHTGPEIQLYLDNKNFQNGQTTTGHPLLMADLFDEYGISYTGQSLGRDMVMVLDDNYTSSEIVNGYFNLDVDTYKKGSLNYQLENLGKGWHKIYLKAWDLLNNSSEKTIDFYVDDQADIFLAEVLNYPNPFINETNFGFIHNKSNSILNVQIMIYDINGRYVGELSKTLGSEGNKITPLTWDGRNQYGSEVSPGVYTYNIVVTDYYGNQSIQRQKMIKLSE